MSTTLIESPSTRTTVEKNGDAALFSPFLRNLRLLIVADSSTTHTLRWAEHFRDRGCDLTILTHASEQIPGVRVIQFPQKHWYHRVPKLRMLLDYAPFQKLIRQLDPQLIHFHFVSEGGRAFYWDRINVPMIATTWGQDVIFDNGPYPGAEMSLRKMLSKARIVTATTHMLARETARYTPPSKPIYIIPFGVDLLRFQLRDEKPNDIITLGFVKWLLPKYGPDILIEAFAAIHHERPNTRLVMAGRGDMREQLENRIKQLNLTDSVQILGRVDHAKVPELIRSFEIMVMPSIYESETFGVAAIEASACAVPVIASRVGGVPEAVLHNETGLLVAPRDPAALAHACIELIDDPPRRRQLGLAGRRFVERYYDWNHNTKQMEEIYRAALEENSPRAIPVYSASRAADLSVPEP
ncbi:MAG TPA: glycosyltransferase [Tepidisphaeraceae bacterium]|nr:glycosyltransferase [Tepidisphaeraceae bacterium]